MSDKITAALADLEEQTALSLVQERLDAGDDPLTILEVCREGMTIVGKRYEADEYFISDLIMAGEIFRQATELLGPELKRGAGPTRGTVVAGTVQGDIHDIGKDIVVTLLKAANYEVHDLGVDVPAARFVEAINETGAAVLSLSGLLTISFDPMKETVAALDEAGLRPRVKVMIGGGPVTETVRAYTGADAWGSNAQVAVDLCHQWTGEG